jgi:ribonuclease E
MARKKKEVKKEEVSRKEINGLVFVTYDDGSVEITMAPVTLTKEQVEDIFGETEEAEEDEEEEETEEEDSDDDEDTDEDEEESKDDEEEEESDEKEEVEITGEDLAGMDFEELEDVCDDNDLDTDPDDYGEDDVEKFRKAIAKELGITLPKGKKESKKSAGKKKK